jgi:ribosomal protein S5
VSTFSGNSARPASTSYGVTAGLTLQEILKAGGWSDAQTFAKHYKKPITRNFGKNILEHF